MIDKEIMTIPFEGGQHMHLLNGDCLKLMKDIPDKSIDMILCDLPYGTTACKWDTVIPFEPLWAQYKRIIKDNGAIVLFGSEPFSTELRHSNLKMFKYDWIWKKSRKTGFPNANRQPLRNYETISVFYKKQCNYIPQGLVLLDKSKKVNRMKPKNETVNAGENDGSLIGEYEVLFKNYPSQIIEFSSIGKTVHPTQKPVALLEYLIKTYTNQGETVLDNCMGSGSTGVACVNTGRKFIGIELDEHYFNVAKKRIEEAQEVFSYTE